MDERLFNLILTIIPVICAVITYYVVPFIKAKIGNENLAQIKQWVDVAVRCAEMLFTGTGMGASKKEYVVNFLNDMLNKNKITITEEQLEVLIESAVKQMKIEESK